MALARSRPDSVAAQEVGALSRSRTSSTKVFHAWQDLHWPIHWGCCVPQDWQNQAFFVLAMLGSSAFFRRQPNQPNDA